MQGVTPEIIDAFREMKDWCIRLNESLAGYTRLIAPVPPDLSFNGTTDGINTVAVVAPLNELTAQMLPHVVVPLADLFRARAIEALQEINSRTTTLVGMLTPSKDQPNVSA